MLNEYIRKQLLYVIFVIIGSLIIWFFFIRSDGPYNTENCKINKPPTYTLGSVKPKGLKGCKTKPCFGHNCKSGSCEGFDCIAGDCYGEECKAGDCNGVGCKAGDCYGYKCIPGKCLINNFPESIKECTDGKANILHKPIYSKIFPYNTFLNPPVCNNSILQKDITNRMPNFNIENVYWFFGGVKKAGELAVNPTQTDRIIGTDPPIYKDDSCNYCTTINTDQGKREYCAIYVPKYEGFIKKWDWVQKN